MIKDMLFFVAGCAFGVYMGKERLALLGLGAIKKAKSLLGLAAEKGLEGAAEAAGEAAVKKLEDAAGGDKPS